jgi:hypothetical protein
MITHRDIAIRAVAQDKAADTPIRDVMTDDILYCFEDQEVEEVGREPTARTQSVAVRLDAIRLERSRSFGAV